MAPQLPPTEHELRTLPAAQVIDRINHYTADESRRSRLLLAALLLRQEGKR